MARCSCTLEGDRICVYLGSKKWGEYILLKEPYCHKCSCPGVSTDKCRWHDDDYGFERLYAMGAYLKSEVRKQSGEKDSLSKHIVGLKQYPRYATPLGLGLVLCVRHLYPELMQSDLIVPVPKFETELKIATDPIGYTYNQAVELSKVLSSNLGIASMSVLRKTRAQSMRGLGADERKQVVQGLYEVENASAVEGKKILIIDDVSTSGATVSECAQVLVAAGAKTVNVLVAGRDTDTSVTV
jgi:hypothetical protein